MHIGEYILSAVENFNLYVDIKYTFFPVVMGIINIPVCTNSLDQVISFIKLNILQAVKKLNF